MEKLIVTEDFYYISAIQKVNILKNGDITVSNVREFISLREGIKEKVLNVFHRDIFNPPLIKLSYIKRIHKRGILKNARLEIRESGDEKSQIVAYFDPPLHVGDRIKVRYSMKFRKGLSPGENWTAIQVTYPARYVKIVVYFPNKAKEVRAFKIENGVKRDVEEKHNFLVNENIAKLELFDVNSSIYGISWIVR